MRAVRTPLRSALLIGACVLASETVVPHATLAGLRLEDAFPMQTDFVVVVDIESPPDGSGRVFVAEKQGRIVVTADDPAASTRTVFLDLRSTVLDSLGAGFQSFTFHPAFPDSPYVFTAYNVSNPLRTRISRWTVSGIDSNAADPTSEKIVMEIPKVHPSHVGMELAFGPDGMLYISVGDDEEFQNGQDRTTLHGSLLRIDADASSGGLPYGIPPDNPFVGYPGREEIFAYGLRNPWRFSIDPVTGLIWLADVGWDTFEEVDVVQSGDNLGWPVYEGSRYVNLGGADTTGVVFKPPVWEYSHSMGLAIIGGYVYRGSDVAGLTGRYVCADWSSRLMWVLDASNPAAVTAALAGVDNAQSNVTTFGLSPSGELLVATYWRVFRVRGTWDWATAADDTPSPLIPDMQAVPNPFNPRTTVHFTLPSAARVSLEVFDVAGRRVRTLVGGREFRPGRHSVEWDGRDRNGRAVASGVYLAVLRADDRSVVRRLVLLK